MSTIFEELNKAYPTIVGTEHEDLRKSALKLVEDFIDSGVWWESATAKEFLNNYRLPVKVYAERTGRNLNSIRSTLSRSSSRIRDRIGFDNITKIVGGSREELVFVMAKLKLATSEVELDNVILPTITDTLKGVRPSKEYELTELTEEIKLLRRYVPVKIKRELELVSTDKLAYLVRLLQSKDGGELGDKCTLLNILSRESK